MKSLTLQTFHGSKIEPLLKSLALQLMVIDIQLMIYSVTVLHKQQP